MSNQVKIRTFWDVKTPMRDGVNLSSDIYLPPENMEAPYPAILMRTPYDNTQRSHVEMAQFFASKGYAFVIQDVRGRCDSDGEWYPFLKEGPDGYDTIEWMAEQAWCNGRVGMMGGSYRGWVQWTAAREGPPHLTTMVSTAAGGYFMKELPFVNGIPLLVMLGWLHLVGGRTTQREVASAVDWEKVFYHLPLKTMDEALGRKNTVWREWIAHPDLDDFWRQALFDEEDFMKIDTPTLHITGWFDADQPGALFFYEGMVEHSPASDKQYILIGPWDHAGTRTPRQKMGGVDFTPAALMDMKKVHLEWFDYWLKGEENDVARWRRAKFFVMGDNRWAEEDGAWPPRDIERVRYYLRSDGKANTLMGDGGLSPEKPGEEPPDTYTYNPEDPVIVVMDFDFYGSEAENPLDNRFILRRDDVLVYTSSPLDRALMVAGRPVVELFATSDCMDTDWFAMLSDVYPDGRSISLGSGGLRARYRNSLETPELMSPGEVYKFRIELPSTCIVFQPGHSIRVAITSSAFPVFARNQNTGSSIPDDTEMNVAHNTVYHDETYLSSILLPAKTRPREIE